jgi:hypothetical protein
LDDDSRHLIGHFLNNEYDIPIPMFLWYSATFASAYPDRVSALLFNATRPVNTRVVFYTLADMAALVLDDPNVERLSLLRQTFVAPKREVFHAWKSNNQITTVDFDAPKVK